MSEEKEKTEFSVKGDALVAKVKELIREGNARRIIIKKEDGTEILRIPVNVGVLGVLIAPLWIALGTAAALLTTCTISIEK